MTRTDPEILSAIDALHPLDVGVVLKLCGAKAGETRNLGLILTQAVAYGANENVVAACFGFAADANRPGEWCDFLLDGSEVNPVIDSPALADAFSIAMTIFGDLVAERRTTANRIVNKLGTLSQTRPNFLRVETPPLAPPQGQRFLKY